jgi:uncharacterized protein (DUF1684 family)
MNAREALELLDWKRTIFALYAEVRAGSDPQRAWKHWRDTRDRLFREHPQSAIPEERRESFTGLTYHDYDDAYRVSGELHEAEPQRYDIPTSGEGTMSFSRVAEARFELLGRPHSLEVYWLEAYGGGIFLPFRDATSGSDTYGAGRYLLDTVKGADLGATDAGLALDFNFAYNPSCSYDPRWVCPLAPPPNRLNVPVRAGETHLG